MNSNNSDIFGVLQFEYIPMEIIPGILEKEWSAIEQKIELVRPFAKTIHIDLLDGKFAPNSTFSDPSPFTKYSNDILLELHMMIEDPLQHVKTWANAGFKRFIGQIEMMPDQEMFVEEAAEYGEVGLALDSPTSIDMLDGPLEEVDFLFVMTVKAGFSNQSFLPDVLEKVRALSQLTKKPIEIDGGVNDETIKEAVIAGATRFVSTGFLFKQGKPEEQHQRLLKACSEASPR